MSPMNQRLMRPRAASAGFSPADIGNLFAWWDPSNSSSVTLSGANVSAVNDLSGNARHLTQSISASRPTYSTGAQNGLAVLSYAGGEYMKVLMSLPSAAFTLFCACSALSSGGSYKRTAVFWKTDDETDFTTPTSAIPLCHATDENLYMFHDANTNGAISILYSFGTPAVGYCAADTAGIDLGQAGAATAAEFGLDGTFAPDQFWLGNSPTANDGAFAGWIGECVMYSTRLGAADISSVLGYLNAKWGLV